MLVAEQRVARKDLQVRESAGSAVGTCPAGNWADGAASAVGTAAATVGWDLAMWYGPSPLELRTQIWTNIEMPQGWTSGKLRRDSTAFPRSPASQGRESR